MRALPAIVFLVLGAATTVHASQDIVLIELPANHIGFSTQTGKLYATVPSRAGLPYGNSLVEIALDGGIAGAVFVGSEPTAMGISPDALVAYVGLQGAAAVRRVDLATLTAGIQFTLGTGLLSQPLVARDIEVMPGSPDTIAVARVDEGVGIYDNGVMRSVTTPRHEGNGSIEFGAQPDVLFGLYSQSSDAGVRRLAISASGVEAIEVLGDVIPPFNGTTIAASGGRIYSTRGPALDMTPFALTGAYGSTGPVVADEPLATVYFANTSSFSGPTTIRTFHRDTFVPMKTDVDLPAGGGNALQAAGCGTGCLAVRQQNDRIVILTHYFTPLFTDSFE